MEKPGTTNAYVRADDWEFVNQEARKNLRPAVDQLHVILDEYRKLRGDSSNSEGAPRRKSNNRRKAAPSV